jgi:hypothetical protein
VDPGPDRCILNRNAQTEKYRTSTGRLDRRTTIRRPTRRATKNKIKTRRGNCYATQVFSLVSNRQKHDGRWASREPLSESFSERNDNWCVQIRKIIITRHAMLRRDERSETRERDKEIVMFTQKRKN